jgi:hypothetical protein
MTAPDERDLSPSSLDDDISSDDDFSSNSARERRSWTGIMHKAIGANARAQDLRDGRRTEIVEAAEADDETGRSGPTIVLGLFVVLAICVVIIFSLFGAMVRPEDRAWVPALMFRYLYMPVVVTSLIVGVDAYRHDRPGWWIFIATSPVPMINMLMVAMWLLKWRDAGKRPTN